jgi:hypothetical protein
MLPPQWSSADALRAVCGDFEGSSFAPLTSTAYLHAVCGSSDGDAGSAATPRGALHSCPLAVERQKCALIWRCRGTSTYLTHASLATPPPLLPGAGAAAALALELQLLAAAACGYGGPCAACRAVALHPTAPDQEQQYHLQQRQQKQSGQQRQPRRPRQQQAPGADPPPPAGPGRSQAGAAGQEHQQPRAGASGQQHASPWASPPPPLLLHLRPGASGTSVLDWQLWPEPGGEGQGEPGAAYGEASFAADLRALAPWLEVS